MPGPRQERRGGIYELESSSQSPRKTPGSGRRQHFGEEKKRAQSMTRSSCRAGTAGGHGREFLSTKCKAGGTQIPTVQASSRHLPGMRRYCGPPVPLQTERAGDGRDTGKLNLVLVRNDEGLAYCTGHKDGVTDTGDGGPPGALQPGMM